MSSRHPITATDILDKQLYGGKIAAVELSNATGSFDAAFGNIEGSFKIVETNLAPVAIAIVFQPKYRVRITDIRVLATGTPVAAETLLFLGGNNALFASVVFVGGIANERIAPASLSLANSVVDGAGGETLKIDSLAGVTGGCAIYLTFENA